MMYQTKPPPVLIVVILLIVLPVQNHVSEMANLQNYLTGTEQSTNCPESVQNRLGLSKLINGYWMPLQVKASKYALLSAITPLVKKL
ncbi:hypothetical protein D3Z60_00965 [Lachnospiraceae bacterium]|nr:hypothetical protein [Lachnospiraceae bacterium]